MAAGPIWMPVPVPVFAGSDCIGIEQELNCACRQNSQGVSRAGSAGRVGHRGQKAQPSQRNARMKKQQDGGDGAGDERQRLHAASEL